MAIAIAFFIPVFVTFLKTGLVPKIPTLLVCGFVAMGAIQAYFSGMILSTINQKNKHDFEFKLIETNNNYKRLTAERGEKDE